MYTIEELRRAMRTDEDILASFEFNAKIVEGLTETMKRLIVMDSGWVERFMNYDRLDEISKTQVKDEANDICTPTLLVFDELLCAFRNAVEMLENKPDVIEKLLLPIGLTLHRDCINEPRGANFGERLIRLHNQHELREALKRMLKRKGTHDENLSCGGSVAATEKETTTSAPLLAPAKN